MKYKADEGCSQNKFRINSLYLYKETDKNLLYWLRRKKKFKKTFSLNVKDKVTDHSKSLFSNFKQFYHKIW